MKRHGVFCALLSVLVCAASFSPASAGELTVFAATSLQKALEELSSLYRKDSAAELSFNFDSSGTLRTQILEGAPCDLFISAAQKQMNELEKAGMIDSASRLNLLQNSVVLAVPQDNPVRILSHGDLKSERLTLIALGNDDVPVGAYSREILSGLGLWDHLQDSHRISFGSNVTEVAIQVREGTADCGMVYSTDAAAHGLKVAEVFPASLLKKPVVYPAAVMKNSLHEGEAKRFLAFLCSPEAAQIFRKAGFMPVEGASGRRGKDR